jgi:asparagine synthase (glutamine-hydrolysing)
MCGFLGEISTQLIDQDSFKKLLDLSIHRGPDQQGYWNDTICQLGFNRLSIIDLSVNGNQPLLSPSGKFALVFNGEVYNYKEIQKKFQIKDSDLRSTSDSEILAHLIEKVSIIDFAKELNGMFAISVYDVVNKKIHLIRDFAGIKPLFYGVFNDGIVFASQFDQVFNHPAFNQKKLQPEIMKEFFGLGYMQAPNTVFENIFQVNPSEIVTFCLDKKRNLTKQKYFSWKYSNEFLETDKDTVVKFDMVFSNVIKNQLHADVPVATFFSGGIDSPLVTAFSKNHKNDIQAYTIGVDDVEYNETDASKKMAEQIGVNQIIKEINRNEIFSVIEEHFQNLSEPFGDYSSLPTYVICKKAKEFATVMLSGDGGDELFWGYPRFHKSIKYISWFRIPLLIRKMIFPFVRKINKKKSSAIDVFKDFEDWILYKQIHFTNIDQLFPKINYSLELLEAYRFEGNLSKENGLNYLKKNEFHAHMQRTLRKVDLMSMANSLEVRVPFLDKSVILFSNSIKPEYGINHKTAKIILRSSLRKYVSKDLINLPKKGFSVPIDDWLRNDLKDDVIDSILNTPFYGSEHLNKDYLAEIISNFYDKNYGNPWGIWHLYSWQKWALKYDLVQNEKN